MKRSFDRSEYPTRLTLDIHSYCNASCVICPYEEIVKNLPMGKMQWDLYAKITKDFGALSKKNGFRGRLGFCAVGEPFLEKDILKFIEYAFKQDLQLNFITNGSVLRPEVVDGLIDLGFDGKFNISCHGITPEVIKKGMNLNVDDMLSNIDYLIDRYPKDRVLITAIHIDWPSGEQAKVSQYWKERGVKVQSPLGGSRAGLVERYNTKSLKRITGCKNNRPLYHMTVSFNGDVTLCCNDMMRKVIVGNLKEETIEEVWNGKKFAAIVDQVYGVLPSSEDFLCKQCEWAVSSRSTFARLRREAQRSRRKIGLWVGEKRYK